MIVDLITSFLQNTAGLIITVALIVFAEMFVAKKWFLCFTKNINSAKVRRAVNMLLGVMTCLALSALEIFAICDMVNAPFIWWVVFLTTFAVTFAYLVVEKIFNESEVNELGNALTAIISKSDKFEGEVSKANVVKIAKELLGRVHLVDKVAEEKVTSKETKFVDEVIDRLSSIISDGVITDEERNEVENALANSNVDLSEHDVFKKYKDMLNK